MLMLAFLKLNCVGGGSVRRWCKNCRRRLCPATVSRRSGIPHKYYTALLYPNKKAQPVAGLSLFTIQLNFR
jgi:hypothetical protein